MSNKDSGKFSRRFGGMIKKTNFFMKSSLFLSNFAVNGYKTMKKKEKKKEKEKIKEIKETITERFF